MKFFDQAHQGRVVSHEEKEENILRFIGYYVDRMSLKEQPEVSERTVTLVARSPQSPVARALIASAQELSGLDTRIQVIFCKLDPADRLSDWVDRSFSENGAPPLVTLRRASNAALLEAHEQLVLGSEMSWTGDCMRREPEKRDAYEVFATFHPEAARRASQSFQSLWAIAEPVTPSRLRPSQSGEPNVAAAPPGLTEPNGSETAPTVSTRH